MYRSIAIATATLSLSVTAPTYANPINGSDNASPISESGLPEGKRRDFANFLSAQFKEKAISEELLAIIMARIIAYAAKPGSPERTPIYPTLTSYPSVATQINWQIHLNEISENFRMRYNPEPKSRMIPIIDETKAPGSLDIEWFAVNAIRDAQGSFSEALNRRVGVSNDDQISSSHPPRFNLGKFTVPVKISETNNSRVDPVISNIIADLIKSLPGSRLDRFSFPSQVNDANILIPNQDVFYSAVYIVSACIRAHVCNSIRDFVSSRYALKTALDENISDTFLSNLYFSDPYGRGHRAVLYIDASGSIKSAFCSYSDMGLRYVEQSLIIDQILAQRCILNTMGYIQ